MNSKLALAFAVFAVVTIVGIQAASLEKREAVEERPEAPLILECEEPGDNRENCFTQDPANHENWRIYLEEIKDWEKKNPTAAATFKAKNPSAKKDEQAKLEELENYAVLHE